MYFHSRWTNEIKCERTKLARLQICWFINFRNRFCLSLLICLCHSMCVYEQKPLKNGIWIIRLVSVWCYSLYTLTISMRCGQCIFEKSFPPNWFRVRMIVIVWVCVFWVSKRSAMQLYRSAENKEYTSNARFPHQKLVTHWHVLYKVKLNLWTFFYKKKLKQCIFVFFLVPF